MQTHTVTAVQVTTTTDEVGNQTYSTLEQDVTGVLFEPQQATERTDSRSPGVVAPAKFYLPVPLPLDADDEVLFAGHIWSVVGGASVWEDQTEVPVQRTGTL